MGRGRRTNGHIAIFYGKRNLLGKGRTERKRKDLNNSCILNNTYV